MGVVTVRVSDEVNGKKPDRSEATFVIGVATTHELLLVVCLDALGGDLNALTPVVGCEGTLGRSGSSSS